MNTAKPDPHPWLHLFANALVPHEPHGPDHSKDPPAPHLLPLSGASEEAKHVLDLLLGADRDIRVDHQRAAGLNLDLAETQIRLTLSHGDQTEMLQLAMGRIALAREALAKGDTRGACAALADAIKAVTSQA